MSTQALKRAVQQIMDTKGKRYEHVLLAFRRDDRYLYGHYVRGDVSRYVRL